jgi:signal transduction histidine kinase/PAS domain-containing protein
MQEMMQDRDGSEHQSGAADTAQGRPAEPHGGDALRAGGAPPAGGRRLEDRDPLAALLRAQRNRLEEVFRQAPSMIAVTRGPEHCFELANPLFVEATGGRALLGVRAHEAFAGAGAQVMLALMDEVYATGETRRAAEQKLRSASGEDAFLNIVYQPLRGADETVHGLLIHAIDVTQFVRARQEAQDHAAALERQAGELQAQATELESLHEEARAASSRLARSEALLSEAQRMAGIGSWEWDMRTGDVLWTEELYRLFGEEPGSVAVNLEAYLERVHADDRDAARQAVARAVETRQPFNFDHRIVRPDGTIRNFHCWGQVWADHAGQPVRLSGSAQDVTEQRAVEDARREDARIVSALHQFGQSIAGGLDVERIVQQATDAATQLTGAEFGAFFYKVINAAGESYTLFTTSGVPREAFSGFPMPRSTAVFEPMFEGEGVVRSDDITRDPASDRFQPYRGMPPGLPVRSYLAVPVMSRSGEVLGGLFFGHSAPGRFQERHERLAVGIAGWAAVALDNARLFAAEHRARAEAERANSAKSDFLATMSHELRTPLNAMIGYSDLMLAGIPEQIPASARPKVERIGLSARHLLQLIEEILTFSRLEAGEEAVTPEDGDAGAILMEVQALLEPLAVAKDLTFSCQLPATPLAVRTDLRKLRQVLLNLVDNAIKFTEAGGVSLTTEQVGDEILFHLTDSGPGVPAHHLEQIFEPFWQVEQGATRSKEGTGLGLTVARRLARLVGGDVTVESAPGTGSHFAVRIPRLP